jgi:hypothetical protein
MGKGGVDVGTIAASPPQNAFWRSERGVRLSQYLNRRPPQREGHVRELAQPILQTERLR